MSKYEYEKTDVAIDSLKFEIVHCQDIYAILEGIKYSSPSICISFGTDLSKGEKDALDTIVELHSKSSCEYYRLICSLCGNVSGKSPSSPTKCPICQGLDISEIVKQDPFLTTRSVDESLWTHFQENDGSILVCRSQE